MSIYQELILDHSRNPRNFKKLVRPSASVMVNNPFCGDRLRLDVHVKKGRITKVGYSGEGCAISVASASLLSEYIKNKKAADMRKLDKNIVYTLLGIELSPNRIKCALLPWEAILKVF